MKLHLPRQRGTRSIALLAVAGAVSLTAACGGTTQPADGGGNAGNGNAAATGGASSAASSSAGGSGGSGNKNIVFSPLALKIPAMKGLSEGVKGYGASKGYQVTIQDPNLDPQKQATQLQQVIETGAAGGAWAIAVQPGALKDVVRVAQEKKIPLVLNGVPGDYGLSGLVPGVSFSTIDYKAQGEAIGKELGTCITDKLGGKAKVLWMESSAGTAGKADLEGAAKEALTAAAPGAQIAATVTVTDRAASQTAVANALQGNPDITAVMGQNDEGTLGALGAFDAAGKQLTCVTEAGGNDEVLGLVKSGRIYAVVALQFQADMAQSFDTLTKMMADPAMTGLQLTVPQKVEKAG